MLDKFKINKYFSITNSVESFIFCTVASMLLSTFFIIIGTVDENLYVELAREGANTELLTAILYLIAGIILFASSYRRYKQNQSKLELLFLCLFGLFFIVVAGEEESWGQWLFNYDVPKQIKNINLQGEFNLHNLEIVREIPFLGGAHRVLNAIIVTLGIILPMCYRYIVKGRKLLNKIRFPVSPIACLPIFASGIIYDKVARYAFSLDGRTCSELREFIFSIGFLLFSISILKESNILEDNN